MLSKILCMQIETELIEASHDSHGVALTNLQLFVETKHKKNLSTQMAESQKEAPSSADPKQKTLLLGILYISLQLSVYLGFPNKCSAVPWYLL